MQTIFKWANTDSLIKNKFVNNKNLSNSLNYKCLIFKLNFEHILLYNKKSRQIKTCRFF